MTCSDVQEVLPELIDVPVDGKLPSDFQSHLRSCAECSDLVSELRTISREARQLVENDEPSPLLWLRIAAQLRSEGLIRDQEPESPVRERSEPRLVQSSPRPRWSLSWLIPVAAMLLVVGTYVAKHQPAPLLSERKAPAVPLPSTSTPTPVPDTPSTTASVPPTSPSGTTTPTGTTTTASAPPVALANKTATATASAGLDQKRRDLEEAAPSPDDEQFLSVVSTRAPSMKATYEKQLQAVNADIRESQAYVDQNPGDADARQHLMEAYQQKALLYRIALDRIQ
jgi:hypothetical protein